MRIWDEAGHPVGEPLTGHYGSVAAVAVGRLGGRDVIVSGSGDNTVRIWDEAGHPVGEPLTGHTGPVMAVAVGRLGGQDVIVSGSEDATVRIWGENEAMQIDFLEPVCAVAITRDGLIVGSGRALVSIISAC